MLCLSHLAVRKGAKKTESNYRCAPGIGPETLATGLLAAGFD
jgi:hypothetical protein